MQMGFSLMETGLVRSKNATTILMKCTLDACKTPVNTPVNLNVNVLN